MPTDCVARLGSAWVSEGKPDARPTAECLFRFGGFRAQILADRCRPFVSSFDGCPAPLAAVANVIETHHMPTNCAKGRARTKAPDPELTLATFHGYGAEPIVCEGVGITMRYLLAVLSFACVLACAGGA